MMRRFPCVALALWLAANVGWSGELTRQMQEELRKRNLYFGEIDGTDSEFLKKAVAKYQSLKGFPQSGVPDEATLQSLGLKGEDLPPALPDVAVLKSDAPRELTEQERQIVEQSPTGTTLRIITNAGRLVAMRLSSSPGAPQNGATKCWRRFNCAFWSPVARRTPVGARGISC